jgi:hypothetical protein
MNTKEFVTKIIYRGQNQIVQRIKSLPQLLSVGLVLVLGLLPMASIPNRGVTAYAQQLQLQLQTSDPWYQSLEIARSKAQAALTPGAFGHGVPELHNLSTNDILMAFGLSVLGGIAVFMAVKALLPYMDKEKISKVSSLLNKMI